MDKPKYGSLQRVVSFSSEKASLGESKSLKMDEERVPDPQPSISFADMGIPAPTQLQDTIVGKARPFSDVSWKERSYVALMLASIIAASVFTIYRLATVNSSEPDFTFGLVLLLNAVFCIWYVIEGVLRERPSELVILTFATIIIMVYLIANYAAGSKSDVKLARLIVACIFCPVLVILGLMIAKEYHDSKHIIFRTVGANETLQTLYRNVLAFQDFLKFDLQMAGSMVILVLVSPVGVGTKDIIILSVGGVLTLAWFLLGFLSMPREIKVGAYIFFAFSPVELAYVGWKLYDVSRYVHSYPGLADATIACGAAAIVVRIIVIIAAVIVVRNFGNGLKEKLHAS